MPNKEIRIGPIVFKVVLVWRLTAEDNTKKIDGHIVYSSSEIKIEAGLEEQRKRQVIWHEIIHGILTQAGIYDQDEKAVDVLAHGVMDVLHDNPWLCKEVSRNA
jgi:hypothetical protein